MTPEEIVEIGLCQDPNKIWLFSDMEDIVFNLAKKELYYHSCIDGELTIASYPKTIEDLKFDLFTYFPNNRQYLNLD